MNAIADPRELFRSQGVPHRRLEDWKYSDLRSVVDAREVERAKPVDWTMSVPPGVEAFDLDNDDYPDWVYAGLHEISSGGAMDAAARAFKQSVGVFYVPTGMRVSKPFCVNLLSSGHGLVVLLVDRSASLTLAETREFEGGGLQNLALSVFLEDGAELTHTLRSAFAGELVTVETISVIQEKNSRYRAHVLQSGAKLSRTELNIELNGEGAVAELSGVSVLGDEAHADITTRITHAAPNTTSRQLFKKVVGGKSRAVYQGKITVKEGSIGSDSRQTAKALLLSNRAEADLKPELEILADDVKCAHGAAVGDLDQDSLFYLRSRGIPEEEARGLLIHAFLQEVIDGIENEEFRKSALAFIDEGLTRAMRSSA